MTVSFQQAAIKVEKAQEFCQAAGTPSEQAFLPKKVERFLKQFGSQGNSRKRIRRGAGGAQRLLENTVGEAGSGESQMNARQLYESLARFRARRRCASFTCRSSKASTSRCATSLRSCISITDRGLRGE